MNEIIAPPFPTIQRQYPRFQNDEVHQVEEVVDHHDPYGEVVWLLQFVLVSFEVDSAALPFNPLQFSFLLCNVELGEYSGEEENEAGGSDGDAYPSIEEVEH